MTKFQNINYTLQDNIATITMNDGGKNVMSPNMLAEINKALDRAEQEAAVVILTGHGDIFSAGFDLKIMKSGAGQTFTMLNEGFALTTRMLSFRLPIIIACNGHAIAMGAFLLLSGDYRIGASGAFKIVTNEVAIGLTMPETAIEVCRQRLTPAHFVRAVMQSEEYNPATALEAGFLDSVVAREDVVNEAMQVAKRFTKLDKKAYYETKMRSRRDLTQALKKANRADKLNIIALGLKRMMK